MKKILLGGKKANGRYVIVDDIDFELVKKYHWSFSGKGYAATHINDKTILMHRLIMNTPEGMDTDHKNNNGLDNRRENLRIATIAENKMNMAKRNYKNGASSKYKGVCLRERAKKMRWRCNVGRLELGSFETEIQAAIAYDKKVKEMYGDFAILNFQTA